MNIPSSYPDEAWYHYDDWTCDYGCMAVEYLYWCIVTNMGILDDPLTCQGIANEWEPCTPELFEMVDTLMFNLVTNSDNKLPQLAPDGNYCPENVEIFQIDLIKDDSDFFVYPNPFNPYVNIQVDFLKYENINIDIYGVNGILIKSLFNSKYDQKVSQLSWDGTNNNQKKVSSGLYFCVVNLDQKRLTKKIIFLK